MSALAGFLAERYIEVNNTLGSDEPLIKITVRIEPQYVAQLDEMAKKLELSRTALATSILENAILDASGIMVNPLPDDYREQVFEDIENMHRMREDALEAARLEGR